MLGSSSTTKTRRGGMVATAGAVLDTAALRALPGIGPYTARAIQAIAFGRQAGAMDTNVRRVLGRVVAGHGSRWDAGPEVPLRELQVLADALVPAERPADWTAALMDIGASVCRPVAADNEASA